MTQEEKIKQILDTLNNVQESLMSVPDDMLSSIDARDNQSLEKMRFIQEFNTTLNDFLDSTKKLVEIIQTHFTFNPEEEDVEQEAGDQEKRQRIIRDLDQSKPHLLGEDFTFKRPYGFTLGDMAIRGLKTWRSLYLNLLSMLRKKDPVRFNGLPETDRFFTSRGNPMFARTEKEVRSAVKIPGGIFAEVKLSAKSICRNMIDLVVYFGYAQEAMKIYLREDRDAGNVK